MTPRAFLVRGLIAGLVAGIAAFIVAFSVGEPSVQAAIDVEESASATTGHTHADEGTEHAEEAAGHSHAEDGAVVSRANQRSWGLATGTLGIGTAFGGLVALVSASVVGRLGRLRPAASTAVVALVGWVAMTLVPFLKYPASPPAVGSGETIGERTGLYFAFLAISLLAAVAGVLIARRLWTTAGTYPAAVAGVGVYLAVVVVAALVLPTVDEIGSFPASTLWSFRVASMLTTGSMWAVLGVVLVGLVGRLDRDARAVADRRALAASL